MRKIKLGVILGVALSAHLYGSTLCSFNGGTFGGGCYSSSSIFTPNDSLDWYNAFGEALTPTTTTGQANPHNLGTQASPTPWVAPATGTGEVVSVSLGPSAQFTNVTRFDNTVNAWLPNSYTFADTVAQDYYPALNENIYTFGGTFAGPPPGQNFVDTPATTVFGDHLLGTTNASGSLTGGGEMTLSFTNPLYSIGFRISSANTTDFNATVTAMNGNSVLGTYQLEDTGDGGDCASLDTFNNPTPCNTAPWIGFISTSANITSLQIEVFNSSGFISADDAPFLIDGLQFDTNPPSGAPEPAAIGLVGIGLAAMIRLSKKSRLFRRG